MKPVNMTVDYNIYKNLTFDFEPKMVQYILNILYHKLYDEC
jgi:hypothetical protein